MKSPYLSLLTLSKPRTWIYLFGPFVIGVLVGATSLQILISPIVIAFLIYFMWPANLLMHGLKEIFDNGKALPKKTSKKVLTAILIVNFPWVLIVILLSLIKPSLILALGGFLFFTTFYYAPPIRAKKRPVLDSIFNIFYVFPSLFGYFLAGGTILGLPIFASAGLWCIARQAFSTIANMESDRKAKIMTMATWMGTRGTLFFCLLLYLSATFLAIPYLGQTAIILGFVYVSMMAIALWISRANFLDRRGYSIEKRLQELYKWFPYINAFASLEVLLTVLKIRL